jgi:NADH-quinone oxidoreductase subunit N
VIPAHMIGSAHLDTVSFKAPQVEYHQLMPMLIVFGAALVGVLLEAFLPRRLRHWTQTGLALAAVATAFGFVVSLKGTKHLAAGGAVAIDGTSLFLQGTVLLLSFVALLMIAERGLDTAGATAAGADAFAAQPAALPGSEQERAATASGFTTTEVFPLTLFAIGGMMLFPAANDLLTMFIALEVLSLPLYLLCGLARRRRLLSQEAAVKYFLLGAFSSAFFLYGAALLYGYSGSLQLSAIASAVSSSGKGDSMALIGMALMGVGLMFKVGAAPFHSWTPDVYQGAPTPVTGFMAAATKVAAFGALLRLLYVALPGLSWDWRPVLWALAIISMLVGAVIAVTQQDIKRMLAYSAILNAGYVLLGVLSNNDAGISSSLFYLVAYGFATIGAFAVVTLVRDSGGEATHLSRWAGLGRRSPGVAAVFSLFLLAFAGIPLTSGFTGKFALFQAAISGGAVPVVIIGVIASAVAAFFYVRVIVLMFFSEPAADGPAVIVPPAPTFLAIFLAAAVTVVLGVYPQFALNIAHHAAFFVS